ncbi:MAG TPA: hypothetical protein VGL59_00440 [Polyangia bacterium]|jgi:hypothetical protein
MGLLLMAMLFAACSSSSSSNDAAAPKDSATDKADAAANDAGADTASDDTSSDDTATADADDAPATETTAGDTATDTSATDTTTDGAGTDATTTQTSMSVTAAAGGSLQLQGASLTIPAGALAADTMITVSAGPPAADLPMKDLISGMVYDLGPNGTQFQTPITLSLPVGAIPVDKDAVIAWLDAKTGAWVPLTSGVSGATVLAQTSHFTTFAVLLVGKGGVCPAVAACGGALPGVWDVTSLCTPQMGVKTLIDCKDGTSATSAASAQFSGTMTINNDNTYHYVYGYTIKTFVTYPAACVTLANNGGNTIAACADLNPSVSTAIKTAATCSGTLAGGCSCVGSQNTGKDQMGAVTATGNNVVFAPTGDQSAPDNNTYCVQGNKLTVITPDGDVYNGVKE